MIISGMLAITTALHYTEPGRGIYTKIMDPSSRSAPGSGSGWGTFDDQSPSSPGSGSSGDNEQSPPRGGWDDLLGGQPR